LSMLNRLRDRCADGADCGDAVVRSAGWRPPVPDTGTPKENDERGQAGA
jgi:hypothetical protein